MKKSIYANNTERFSLLFFFLLIAATFTVVAQHKNDNQKVQVYHIQNYFSEAYLIKR
ncbi:hypothetical protein [Flavobacterium sp. CLA17]|uniref:hypothetical protein n=1 Tax=Flavobacterium sp. CLA17 TaxID=2724135 RepID=UPI001491BF33|nr:hypothetical protein [Flavobacterium sp. CLA17]QSB25695.1 hypothetical protein HAV12_015095 [Flavobacterium sp. CLA17]